MGTREWRFTPQGNIFVLVLTLLLAAGTQKGQHFIGGLLAPAEVGQTPVVRPEVDQKVDQTPAMSLPRLALLIPFVLALLASPGLGYVINWFVVAGAAMVRGKWPGGFYSGEWKKHLSVDIGKWLRNKLEGTPAWDSWLCERWEKYDEDIFLSYFWQQAPPTFVGWVSRRHTVYWAGLTTIYSVLVASLLAVYLSVRLRFGILWWPYFTGILIFAGVMCLLIYLHAWYARTEAWRLIDIWLFASSGAKEGPFLKGIENFLEAMKETLKKAPRKSFTCAEALTSVSGDNDNAAK